MFVKYPKTYRILVPQINIKGKHYLSKDEVKKLLVGNVIILEKLDGANTGIVRHKDTFKLQKRGSLVDDSEHYQFQFFKAWAYSNYDKIIKIPEKTILYGELMICKHTIFYNNLPDFFIPFAWYNVKTEQYYTYDETKELCDSIGFSMAPLLYKGHIDKESLFDIIPNVSNFGDEKAEGIVVWNYKNNIRGKVVREEFQKSMNRSGHWRNKKIILNKLGDKDK